MLQRKPGWHARLDSVIDDARHVAFDWRDFNCGHLAQSAVLAITGERLGQTVLGKARSLRTATSVMRRAGFDNLGDLLASLLPEIHPSQAYVGDIAAIESDDPLGYSLGVVGGERIFVIGQEFDGLGTVDLLTAKRAFKVG
ncbi:MAG: DUF6950 family protein [Minisyncoccota bacterium]